MSVAPSNEPLPPESSDEDDVSRKPISAKVLKQLEQQFCQCVEDDFSFVANSNRLMLLEVCCAEDSVLTQACCDIFGPDTALRVSHWNGGDIETKQGREYVKKLIREKRPRLVWLSPECGPFSPMQHLNQKSEKQRLDLQEKRKHARLQYDGVCELGMYSHSIGVRFLIELSERCEAWQLPVFQKLKQDLQCSQGVCKGCQVGLRDNEGLLLSKGWKMLGTDHELIRHMSLRCTTDHPHGKCEGHKVCRKSAFYTPEFAKRAISHLKDADRGNKLIQELKDCHFSHGCDVENPQHEKDHDHEVFAAVLDRKQKAEIMSKLRRIHSATGHCSVDYLVRALKRRNAKPEVIELAKNFRCPICEEQAPPKPRPQATLESLPPKWPRMQADVGSWVHPENGVHYQFILAIDEGSRFRIGKFLGEGKHLGVSGEHFKGFFEEHWRPLFGNPSVIRLDPAGAFRSTELDEYFGQRRVVVEHIPAEAHWQISLVERSIKTTKGMLTTLQGEFPEMSFRELFARVVWAQNSRDQYLGFSPVQHALGKGPNELGEIHDDGSGDVPIITERGLSAEFGRDEKAMKEAEKAFVEEQYKHRLSRAEHSGTRRIDCFSPGDLVFYWRKQLAGKNREQNAQTFRTGAFLGPARVLATETRKNEDGSLRPGNVVWLFRGNRLIKAAPQQLRYASDREAAWCELRENVPIPWTISGILEGSKRKTYEDISGELPPLDEMEIDSEDSPQAPLRRFRRKGPDNDPRPPESKRVRPSSSSAPPVPEDDHELLALVSDQDSPHLEDELACLSIEIDLPSDKDIRKEHWTRDLGAYIVNQAKTNHVEVHERKLSAADLEKFKAAKQKEIKNYILAKVFEKIPFHQRPSRDQVLKMRWVLTWKFDKDNNEKKAKARAVILGYQDPQYELRATASPTMTRTTRQLFLTMCSAYEFQAEKGDVSGAFLQGRQFADDVFVEPLKEICEELKLPEGSITRLTRAAYGLVQAPLEWYLTVDEFLRSLGFERQHSDPCCWGLFDSNNAPVCYICGHVDDFLFGGLASDDRWSDIKKKIKERFKWGEWEVGKFTQCGVDIEQRQDGSFSLQQPSFLEQVSEVYVSKQRHKELEAYTTKEEQQQMRSVLGCLSWHAGQVAMELSAPVGLLLSKVNQSVVHDIIEMNKLLRKAKARRSQAIIIHKQKPEDILLAAWVDAAHANRPDLSSTKGIFIGSASKNLLDGSMETVNPIYWNSSKITRVCRSSASAETRAAVDGEDQMYSIRFQLSEFRGTSANVWNPDLTAKATTGVLISDSKNLFDRLSQTMLTLKGAEKRSDLESLCLKESMSSSNVIVRWVNGDSQLGNSLTKENEPHQLLHFMARNGRWRIIYDESLMSGRKRKSLGLQPLEATNDKPPMIQEA